MSKIVIKEFDLPPDDGELRISDGFPGQILLFMPESVSAQFRTLPLIRDLMVIWTGYFPHAYGHFILRPDPGLHQRPVPDDHGIVIYCVAGLGWCRNESGEQLTVRAGELVLIPPNTPHGYGASRESPWSIYWFHIAGDRVDDYLEMLGANDGVAVAPVGLDTEVIDRFEQLLAIRREGYGKFDILATSAMAGEIMVMLARNIHTLPAADPGNEPPIKRVIAHMKRHVNDLISLEECAQVAALSISQLTRRFKAATGFTPMDYFTHLKMMKACSLLLERHKIATIAADLGYSDGFTFSRTFKRVMGMAPAHYRQHHRV